MGVKEGHRLGDHLEQLNALANGNVDADAVEEVAAIEEQLELGRHDPRAPGRSGQLHHEARGRNRDQHPDRLPPTVLGVVDDPGRPRSSLVHPSQCDAVEGSGESRKLLEDLLVDFTVTRPVLLVENRPAERTDKPRRPVESPLSALVEQIELSQVLAANSNH